MGVELKRVEYGAAALKNALLSGNTLGVLLYIAKYNPGVSLKDITSKFGKEATVRVEKLRELHLVAIEPSQKVSITNEGIFQVDGLLQLA